jgi:hypothetical protein
MSGATFDDVDTYGMLKELYSDDVQYQERVLSSFFNFIRHAESGEVEFDGKYFNQPVTWALNESYGAKNDTERLPEPDFQAGTFAKYRPKLMYSAIEATTFAATRGHKNGRPNGKFLDDTVKGTLLSFMSNLDSDALGNGRGYRATVLAATPGASSFTVKFSTRLRPKMKLDWYNSALTTKRGSIKIALKSVDRMNRTVYVDTTFGSLAVPAAAAADDVVLVYGALAAGEPSDGRHMAGYDRLADNSVAIGQLDPANYAAWQAITINAGLANPTQELLQQAWDNMRNICEAPNRAAFNSAWKRAYLNGFLNQRRFTSNVFNTGAADLSWTPTRMGRDEATQKVPEIQMLEDKNVDPTRFLFWVHDAFCYASDYSDAPHLADEDGAEFRIRPGYDSMSGFYRFWGNTVVKKRNGIGQIYNFAPVAGTI